MDSIMVFTDLDGTFIDFETYAASVAGESARKLVSAGIPVVFCSSKTYAEQKALMKEVGITCPGIVENGSGFFIPRGYALLSPPDGWADCEGDWIQEMGASLTEISDAIDEVEQELAIDLRPYAKLMAPELAGLTGLSLEAAMRAKDRRFSETLTAVMSSEQWTDVNAILGQHGLRAVCGGRFHTVTSKACDKGKALQALIVLRAGQCNGSVKSVAIGDSVNDVPMLQAADRAYLVQRPDGIWNDIDIPGLIKVPAPGPTGWVQVAEACLAGNIFPGEART